MIPKTLIFTPPKRLPEANIQAELYRLLRNSNIKCCLEYRMLCKETDSFLRADIVTIKNNRITSIIECKSRDNNFNVNTSGKQYYQYSTFGIPIFYCMNFKHVTRTVNLVELLHTQGLYDNEYLQTFENKEKVKPKTKKDIIEEKKVRFKKNWDLLLASNLEYTCFSQSHIRICNKVDLWPGSGKWMVRGENKSSLGGFPRVLQFLNKI